MLKDGTSERKAEPIRGSPQNCCFAGRSLRRACNVYKRKHGSYLLCLSAVAFHLGCASKNSCREMMLIALFDSYKKYISIVEKAKTREGNFAGCLFYLQPQPHPLPKHERMSKSQMTSHEFIFVPHPPPQLPKMSMRRMRSQQFVPHPFEQPFAKNPFILCTSFYLDFSYTTLRNQKKMCDTCIENAIAKYLLLWNT